MVVHYNHKPVRLQYDLSSLFQRYDIHFFSGDGTILKPGFEVSLGSTLSASQSMYCKVYNGALELAGGQ